MLRTPSLMQSNQEISSGHVPSPILPDPPGLCHSHTESLDVTKMSEVSIPLYLDLRRHMPKIPDLDQKNYQVVKAFCLALNYELVRSRKVTVFPPSYEYLKYFLEKSIGATQLHSFQHLSEIIKSFGIAGEAECRNNQQKSPIPTDDLLDSARKYRHIQLKIVEATVGGGRETLLDQPNYIDAIKANLQEEKVVLMGMPWYSNFLKSRNMPTLSIPTRDDFILGGFCGIIVGFIEKDRQWIVATCRGQDWGDHGYIYLPYHVLTKTGGELVTIELNEELIQLEMDSSRYPSNKVSDVRGSRTGQHKWGESPGKKGNSASDTVSISRTLY